MLPSSCGSSGIPMWPLYFGSNRDWTLSILSLMIDVLYAIAVQPDCHAIVYLLPGSHDGFFTSGPAFLSKFGISDWSRGTSHPLLMRNPSAGLLFVITMMSKPVYWPA